MNSNVKTISKAFFVGSTAMLLACVLVVSSAFADGQIRSETVKFQDLKVGTPAGGEALYRRIHAAAGTYAPSPAHMSSFMSTRASRMRRPGLSRR